MAKTDPKPRVLVVDDHVEMAEMLAEGLSDRGFDARAMASGTEAAVFLEESGADVLVTDLRMQGLDGLELLSASLRNDASRPVIVMTAYGAVDTAIESIRRGAYHYLTKPFKLDELVIFVRRALDEVRLRREATALRRALDVRKTPGGMLGRSRAMRPVFDAIDRIADTTAPVLITGETGTGKGLAAAALHAGGRRSAGPFVTVNCAALPEHLIESELFGHLKGAFTGATENRPGLFAEAHGGTIFLDEIGEIPLVLQPKLLHALERQRVRPVGSSREREVDVRVISATNQDPRELIARGAFREDLLYRLDVVTIEMPPLRQRREDIPELLGHFLARALEGYSHSPVRRFSPEALHRLMEYRWPGNVRELAHVVERLVLLVQNETVAEGDLPASLHAMARGPQDLFRADGGIQPIRDVQRAYARWALGEMGGNRTQTAERLGVDVKTLAKWLTDRES